MENTAVHYSEYESSKSLMTVLQLACSCASCAYSCSSCTLLVQTAILLKAISCKPLSLVRNPSSRLC